MQKRWLVVLLLAVSSVIMTLAQSENAQTFYEEAIHLTWFEVDFEGALEKLDQAIEEDPTFADAYAYRAYVRQIIFSGQENAAVEQDYQQAISLAPNNAMGYFARGSYRLNRGNTIDGERDLREALRLDPDLPEAIWGGALLEFLNNNWQGVIEQFGTGELAYPAMYALRGDAYFGIRDHLNAVDDFSQALESRPISDYFRRRGLAYLAYSERNLPNSIDEEALALAEMDYLQALRLRPNNAQALNDLGVIAEHRGDYITALDYYEAALGLNENYENARVNGDRVREQAQAQAAQGQVSSFFIPDETSTINPVTSTPTASMVTNHDMIYSDSFEDNRGFWWVASGSDFDARIENGSYMLDITYPEGYDFKRVYTVLGEDNWSESLDLTSAYSISFDFSATTEDPSRAYLFVLFDVLDDYESFKYWGLRGDGDGYWNFGDSLSGIYNNDADYWMNSIFIFDGQVHRVRVDVTRAGYAVYVDERLIATAASRGSIDGSIGFGFQTSIGSAQLVVDNLTVVAIQENTITYIRPTEMPTSRPQPTRVSPTTAPVPTRIPGREPVLILEEIISTYTSMGTFGCVDSVSYTFEAQAGDIVEGSWGCSLGSCIVDLIPIHTYFFETEFREVIPQTGSYTIQLDWMSLTGAANTCLGTGFTVWFSLYR